MIEEKYEKALTKKDVAAQLQVSKRTVDNLMARGLPYIKLGGKIVRFRQRDIDTYFATVRVN